jgi:hypothetical protein
VAGWCANLPADVQHLKPVLDEAAVALASNDPQRAPEHVRAIATAYLCVFDTAPFWKVAPTGAQWTKLGALRLAAAAVAKQNHSNMTIQMFVNEVIRSRRADSISEK